MRPRMDVLRVAVLVHADVGEEVDNLAQTPFVELGPCEVLRQDVLQAPVFRVRWPAWRCRWRCRFRGVWACAAMVSQRASAGT